MDFFQYKAIDETGRVHNGQADAANIADLEMRLQRLTGLERDKIENEYKELITTIEKLKAILDSRNMRMEIIKNELLEIRDLLGGPGASHRVAEIAINML